MDQESFIKKVIYGGGFVFDFARWLLILVIVLVLVHYFIITIYIVDGVSMDPTFQSGEVGILSRFAYSVGDPKRGDIVVVKYPGDPEHKRYVKRIIGLPNETISVGDSAVYINEKKLTENYLDSSTMTDKDGKWKLGKDEYFLMGDNRFNSNDSRYFGPVEERFIIGKTVWILIPRFFSVVTPSYVI